MTRVQMKVAELANYFDVLFDPIETTDDCEVVISANEAGRAHFEGVTNWTWYKHCPHKDWHNAYVTTNSPREQFASELALAVATDNPSLRVGLFEGIAADGGAFVRKVADDAAQMEALRAGRISAQPN